MRNLMKKYLLCCLVVTQLFGCSKNEDLQPDPVDPDPVPTILSKFVTVDTTKDAPYDTLYMSAFDYDGQGRIAKQTHYNYLPSSGQYEFYSSFAFTYNGTDTVASVVTENLSANNFTIRWKHFLVYNAANELISDSSQTVIINWGNYDSTVSSTKYQHLSNGFSSTKYLYFPGPTTVDPIETTTIARDTRGNITSMVPLGQSGFSTSYEFDTRLNPLYKVLPVYTPYVTKSAYPSFSATPAIERLNNFYKQFTVNYDAAGNISNPVLVKEFLIIYHANGMPSSIRARSTPASMQDKYKYVFIYR